MKRAVRNVGRGGLAGAAADSMGNAMNVMTGIDVLKNAANASKAESITQLINTDRYDQALGNRPVFEKVARDNDYFVYKERPNMSERAGLEEVDYRNRDNKEPSWKDIGLGAGAVLGTAGLAHAVAHGDPKAPFRAMRDVGANFARQQPKNFARRAGFKDAYNSFMRAADNVGRGAFNVRDARRKARRAAKGMGKRADDHSAKDAFIKAASTGFGERAKKLVRDDFLRGGLEAIPYVAAPVAARAAYNKVTDMQNPANVKIVDMPRKEYRQLQKEASDSRSWGQWAREELPKSTARGLGRAVIPAVAGGALAMAQNEVKKRKPVPKGHVRVKVTHDPETGNDSFEKMAARIRQDAAGPKNRINSIEDEARINTIHRQNVRRQFAEGSQSIYDKMHNAKRRQRERISDDSTGDFIGMGGMNE